MRKIIAVLAMLFISPLAGQETAEDTGSAPATKTEQTVIILDGDVESLTVVIQEGVQDSSPSRDAAQKINANEKAGQSVGSRKPMILLTIGLIATLLLGVVVFQAV